MPFGGVKMKDLNEQDLQMYINKLADDGCSKSIVKNSILYLRAILNHSLGFSHRVVE
jgi:hypothetical protein